MENFHARGLTAAQWTEWCVYLRNFPTPMRRADINSALERFTHIALTPGFKQPKEVERLIPEYGNKGKRLTDEQLEEIRTWGTDLGNDF